MKKITIYVLSLNYGGAERAITNIANILSINNKVIIKSIYKLNDDPFYELKSNIDIMYLTNIKPNRDEFKNALKRINVIKLLTEGIKAIKILYLKRKSIIKSLKKDESDIIITTRKEHNYYSAKYANKKSIKIGQEHNDFSNHKNIRKVIKGAKNLDYFMPSSQYLTNKYKELLKAYKVIIKYIPFSIEEYKLKSFKKENQVIAIGRLEKVKAFDDLIDVFEIVHKRNSDLRLVIIGTGSEEKKLKSKVKIKKLEDYIIFKGKMSSEELQKEYEKSKLLIVTSHSESFGLVALEAANAEIATIAFDSANGLKEILENSGILISKRDKKEMANNIINILKNNQWKELGTTAKNNISKYYTANIEKEWQIFVNDVSKNISNKLD